MSTQEIKANASLAPVLREVWHYLKFFIRQREDEAWADVLPARDVEKEVFEHP